MLIPSFDNSFNTLTARTPRQYETGAAFGAAPVLVHFGEYSVWLYTRLRRRSSAIPPSPDSNSAPVTGSGTG